MNKMTHILLAKINKKYVFFLWQDGVVSVSTSIYFICMLYAIIDLFICILYAIIDLFICILYAIIDLFICILYAIIYSELK